MSKCQSKWFLVVCGVHVRCVGGDAKKEEEAEEKEEKEKEPGAEVVRTDLCSFPFP